MNRLKRIDATVLPSDIILMIGFTLRSDDFEKR